MVDLPVFYKQHFGELLMGFLSSAFQAAPSADPPPSLGLSLSGALSPLLSCPRCSFLPSPEEEARRSRRWARSSSLPRPGCGRCWPASAPVPSALCSPCPGWPVSIPVAASPRPCRRCLLPAQSSGRPSSPPPSFFPFLRRLLASVPRGYFAPPFSACRGGLFPALAVASHQ